MKRQSRCIIGCCAAPLIQVKFDGSVAASVGRCHLAQLRENPMDYSYADREFARSEAFEKIWTEVINDVFADVARYYDRANVFATLGLIDPLRRRFIATMDLRPNERVLDV